MSVPKVARGQWDGQKVRVEDPKEAGRLWNRHAVGDVLPGGGLRLTPIEAAHCILNGWLDAGVPAAQLLSLPGPAGARQEVLFLAYRDLRDRGVVVRHEADGFAVWDRGASPPDPPAYKVHCAGEREPAAAARLLALAAAGTVAAIVDDDGEPTYYRLSVAEVAGSCPLPEGKPPARKLTDRVLVDAPQPWSERVRPGSKAPLFLSMTEAVALARLGRLDLPNSRQALAAPAVAVATDLWKRGVMARSGFRFGTHLRGYREDPQGAHAEYLVHCAKDSDALDWTDLSRGVRLAHGVRKRFLVAVAGADVKYAEVAWFKP